MTKAHKPKPTPPHAPELSGDEVRAIREATGWTQEMLARAAALYDSSGWRQWERAGCKGSSAVLLTLIRDSAEARELLLRQLDAIDAGTKKAPPAAG